MSESEILAKEVFDNATDLIKLSMEITSEDYSLLCELNTVAASRYAIMTERVCTFRSYLEKMLLQYVELKPHLDQIKELQAQVNQLHQVVVNLDEYTKRLELQFNDAYSVR